MKPYIVHAFSPRKNVRSKDVSAITDILETTKSVSKVNATAWFIVPVNSVLPNDVITLTLLLTEPEQILSGHFNPESCFTYQYLEF